jgi:hypothetical protein
LFVTKFCRLARLDIVITTYDTVRSERHRSSKKGASRLARLDIVITTYNTVRSERHRSSNDVDLPKQVSLAAHKSGSVALLCVLVIVYSVFHSFQLTLAWK